VITDNSSLGSESAVERALALQHASSMSSLILKRASASHPSGEWNDGDFDVLATGVVVGRIFKANKNPRCGRSPSAIVGRPANGCDHATRPPVGTLARGSLLVLHMEAKECVMDWNRIEGNWKQFKGQAKEKWGRLTDDDLNVINGRQEQLEGKIQERYGLAKDQAKKDVETWFGSLP
jgi:uncharacterized protein YjbJ (UPF0337 family)